MSTLPRSIQGLSQVSGLNFRDLLEANLGQIPFTFPPQVQQGIDAANQISDALGLDVRIPSVDEVKARALGEIDDLLGGLGRSPEVQEVLGQLGTAQDVLNSIDWLR